ncbi:MAG: SufB/SufD family protein [Chitinispirillaceae bacterium]
MNSRPDPNELIASTDIDPKSLLQQDVAHVLIHGSSIVGLHAVPGLHVDARERHDGVETRIRVDNGAVIAKTVQFCFGVLPQKGTQHIIMDLDIGEEASLSVRSHCVFPHAVDVKHIMDARVRIGAGARYSYEEHHVHSPQGGITVIPRAKIQLDRRARFSSEFVLLRGRVGRIDLDYEAVCEPESTLEMNARINATADDRVYIREAALLHEAATGVLTSKIAVRDRSRAEIINQLIADGPGARGHVDCKEIIQDKAVARAEPIVEVRDPHAHVTHEAAIGSVDDKQLETLMARGLTEDDAVDIIIGGLLGSEDYAAPR